MQTDFQKEKFLYFTQSAAGILALILGLFVIFGHVQVWMVYILAFALGMVNVIDNPARQTFIHEMVDKQHFPNAIALNTIEINVARVLGPALAGILIVSAGLGICFILNAVSYIAVLIALYMMAEKDLHITPLVEKAKGQLREGFKYVMSSPVIRDTLIMMAIIGTLTYEFTVSLPLLAQFAFHGNAGTYAAFTSAMGVGSIIGGLFIASRKKTTPRGIGNCRFFIWIICFGGVISANSCFGNWVFGYRRIFFSLFYFAWKYHFAIGISLLKCAEELWLCGRLHFWAQPQLADRLWDGLVNMRDHDGHWLLAELRLFLRL